MKVYVKKEDKNPMFPGIIATVLSLAFAIVTFISRNTSGKTLSELFSEFGLEFLFALMSLVIGICCFYALVKHPKNYKAKLVNKNIEIYKNQQITYMEFSTMKKIEQEEDLIPKNYMCYTIGENNLIIGKDYALGIKEFNWEPKYVTEINNLCETNKNKVQKTIPSTSMTPVFFAVGAFCKVLVAICILGMLLYPKYTVGYIIVGTVYAIIAYRVTKAKKIWKIDNNIEKNENYFNWKLEKIKPLNNKQEKVGNVEIKQLIFVLVLLSTLWLVTLLKMSATTEDFVILSLPIIIVELIIVAMALYDIGYYKRLIKKHKVNITENVNIASIKQFNIFRTTATNSFSQYLIIDQNNNLIFKIKKADLLGRKLIICNQHDIKLGEIKSDLLSITSEYAVNIIDKTPFIVRAKFQFNSNYQIIGRKYYVKGDMRLIRNIIYDDKENDVAYISAVSHNNNNWYNIGDTEVLLAENVNNNIDIMMIALCITLGNLKKSIINHS